MEVVIGKLAGFCPGVEHAVKVAKEKIESAQEKIYCLGEMVHNKQVVESLEEKGMITIENIEDAPDGSTVIFRAHGEAKKIYELAEKKNINVIDLTCGKVMVIHNKIEKEKENSFIIIVGKKSHPEVIGSSGFAGKNYYVVENEDDVLDAYMEYEKECLGKSVYVISQTTMKDSKFDDIAEEIKLNFAETDVIIDKTICDATKLRQEETRKLSKEADATVVIGGKNSSNTIELVNIAKENCKNVYSIETVDEIKDVNFNIYNKVLIMAGASTPKESIEGVREFLNKF